MTNRKWIFVVLLLVIQLGLIWPIYSFFSGINPMIFGLPLSFAWVIALLLSSFFLLLWYHLSEPAQKPEQPTDTIGDR